MTWYLRSIGDHDTHRGVLRPAEGIVVAAGGVTFVPKVLAFGRLELRGTPPDPEQVCPACARSAR